MARATASRTPLRARSAGQRPEPLSRTLASPCLHRGPGVTHPNRATHIATSSVPLLPPWGTRLGRDAVSSSSRLRGTDDAELRSACGGSAPCSPGTHQPWSKGSTFSVPRRSLFHLPLAPRQPPPQGFNADPSWPDRPSQTQAATRERPTCFPRAIIECLDHLHARGRSPRSAHRSGCRRRGRWDRATRPGSTPWPPPPAQGRPPRRCAH